MEAAAIMRGLPSDPGASVCYESSARPVKLQVPLVGHEAAYCIINIIKKIRTNWKMVRSVQ